MVAIDEVGDALRALRHALGWSLAEVERRSAGEWSAAVVGAYERGDRTISIPRLHGLTALYDAVPTDVLPDEPGRSVDGQQPPLCLDLAALAARAPAWDGVRRYAATIQARRGDASDVLTVRADDVIALAVAERLAPDELRVGLEGAGLTIVVASEDG